VRIVILILGVLIFTSSAVLAQDNMLSIPETPSNSTDTVDSDSETLGRTQSIPQPEQQIEQEETLEPVYVIPEKKYENEQPTDLIIIEESKKIHEQDVFDLLEQMPPDIQGELLDEGKDAENYCSRNYLLAHFYDCPCLGIQFINERIQKGPDVGFLNLISQKKTYDHCVFKPSIFGFAYDRCERLLLTTHITDEKLDQICRCTGRSMAENFTRYPSLDIAYVDHLFRDKIKACKKREYR